MNIKWIGAHSNNYEAGRKGQKITKVVLHWIVGKLSAADATFQDSTRIASAHYGIGPSEVHQYVKEEDTAYHAGNLTINRQSIGIEHQGGPDLPISEDTYKQSIELVADICKRYGIPADREHILKHNEIKSTQCPGTLDVDRIVNDVAKLLINDQVDWQIKYEQVKQELNERDEEKRFWEDITRSVAEELKVPAEKTILIAEVKKFITLEDSLVLKEKDLLAKDEAIGKLETTLKKLEDDKKILENQNEQQQRRLTDLSQDLVQTRQEIEDLKKTADTSQLSGPQLILKGIAKLFTGR